MFGGEDVGMKKRYPRERTYFVLSSRGKPRVKFVEPESWTFDHRYGWVTCSV